VRTLGASLLLSLSASVMACSAAGDDAVTGDDQNQTSALTCLPAPACGAAPAFTPPPHRDWRHAVKSRVDVTAGSAHHRGRDLFVNPGAKQTIIGKIAYGIVDKDLEDEEVDVYAQRDCGSAWELLGSTITTGENGREWLVQRTRDFLDKHGFPPSDAYGGANVQPADHRIFYQISGAFTGRRIESYTELVPGFEPLPGACH
jgi:hypothetical protein